MNNSLTGYMINNEGKRVLVTVSLNEKGMIVFKPPIFAAERYEPVESIRLCIALEK